MDAIIDARFERLEAALAKLINSIATYNPSPVLATDLVAADAELSSGLEQLSTHQLNHTRILALRQESTALDSQIKDTLSLLVSTRRDLLATPASVYPSSTYPVSHDELLTYARRISKFTLPPTYRAADISTDGTTTAPATTAPTPTPKDTNGTGTPGTARNGDTQMSGMEDGTPTNNGAPAVTAAAATTTTTGTSLPPQTLEMMDPNAGMTFLPWPSEETIRMGALASIQLLQEQGKDLETWVPEADEVAKLDEEVKERAEAATAVKEEEPARIQSAPRPSVSVQAPAEKFQFALEDESDEEAV